MLGLDAGQEYDFVLSLAQAAGLQTWDCSILSTQVRSADKETDVIFEVLVQDAQAADDYARKIGEIIDDGQLALALNARGLPRAVVRSQPRPYRAGLPVPMSVAGESAFTGLCIRHEMSPPQEVNWMQTCLCEMLNALVCTGTALDCISVLVCTGTALDCILILLWISGIFRGPASPPVSFRCCSVDSYFQVPRSLPESNRDHCPSRFPVPLD